eukprot:TRINITY_DN17472_c0_g1_i1.p1 TRINITY_DN17472_c0_g1~~TRINITY_DN17472_c0_g1_i1.p1  ORF type:complete len:326 (+),score=78.34 TRINITY_DN17472_c0_g1_i1:78-1055(+)
MTGITAPPLPKIKDILRIYGLRATQRLSQNFILDLRLTAKLARSIKTPKGCTVIEVGSGPGSLTRSILNLGVKKVIAIEKDERFLQTLRGMQQVYGEDRLKVVHGDALEIDERDLIDDLEPLSWERKELPKLRIAGNLPFNIASPLLSKWMSQIESRQGAFAFGRVPLYLMFQKEVAQRIVAPHDTPEFGRASIMVQNLCEAEITSIINGKSFVPPAKVDAGFVEIIPRHSPLYDGSLADLELVARELLNTRRKMLKTSLKRHFQNPEILLQQLQLDENIRPGQLSLEQWCQLTKVCVMNGLSASTIQSHATDDEASEGVDSEAT